MQSDSLRLPAKRNRANNFEARAPPRGGPAVPGNTVITKYYHTVIGLSRIYKVGGVDLYSKRRYADGNPTETGTRQIHDARARSGNLIATSTILPEIFCPRVLYFTR